jgi:putative OPT family oligopeptide transporter
VRLRALGGGGILENNIVQTGASAGSSIASGVIFTIPALVILGYWQEFKYGWGTRHRRPRRPARRDVLVPLRRSLIVDQGLAFPEGKAAAEVLKTGENPGRGEDAGHRLPVRRLRQTRCGQRVACA